MRESLVLYRDDPQPRPPLPEWADSVGDVRPARHDELPPGFPRGLRFTVPLVEMPRYLPFLYDVVIRAGGTHVNRRITGLDDVLSPDVIVNAAGLAAGALVGDATVFPIRGQIVRVAIPASTCRSATKCIREAGRRFTRARQIASSAARLRSAAGTRNPTPPRLPRASNGAPTSSPRSSAQAYSKPSWDCGQDARRSGWRWTATYCRYL
jgi:glycine/D-amino acid oxidase-like deaminating enzyme